MENTSYKSTNKTKKTNLILLLLAIVLIIIPLVFNSGAEYGGADDQAEGVISEVNPGYEPWFSSIYEPPSGEIESLLFAVQAALGAGVVGYYLGSRKNK
ncbi:energy-coupling factor ABC transporter substrate-binding protein [Romboutsia maritimum]|uniref:Cobalt transport protein CbiN n=1 Tax=Romboutsia maritimum TaxID=2020948 RepID=A0A371IUC2_9FIRM|nr:energy-coupling factor ABC transporter substrate-binding protein [Romboutsia maritimum]RDY24065.1 energy-coupling factor ABC transporter substrate-binding protein [Romboutsia maritimum]